MTKLTPDQRRLGDAGVQTLYRAVRRRGVELGSPLYDVMVTTYLRCCRRYRPNKGVTFEQYAHHCLMKARM